MFSKFKEDLHNHMTLLLANEATIYETNVSKDLLWETYLNNFPEAERQEHTCNSCKQFIRACGNMVVIVNNLPISIWAFQTVEPYNTVVKALNEVVMGASIADVFLSEQAKQGTDSNAAMIREEDGSFKTVLWKHMFFLLPKKFVHKDKDSIDTVRGEKRTSKQVLKRALDEITLDAIDTVLELIAQNSLYRGKESESILRTFQHVKNGYDKLPANEKEGCAWIISTNSSALARIRNTAIGTLLVSISEGTDLDIAVAAFERIMAPANYKRPTALITTRMVQDAEKTIEELGLTNSLGRRFATPEDVTVNNVLFVDRSLKQKAGGVLGELKEDAVRDPKTFSKIEEVPVDMFIKNVLPKSTAIDLFVENKNYGNFMSLIAPQDKSAPSPLKWDNNFSWSYQDNMADSIKEKVKAAGGNVTGYMRISLGWNNYDDLDLHVVAPNEDHIFYGNKKSRYTGGELDVDMNVRSYVRGAVENIVFPTRELMKEGIYKVIVNNFTKRESTKVGYTVEIEVDGKVEVFTVDDNRNSPITSFRFSRKNGVEILIKGAAKEGKVNSTNIWGIDTYKFHQVNMILKSPNHWDTNAIGNEHLFFILDKAHNDKETRGFFNEFLKEDLMKHKRVFEALGSKMKVAPAVKQLSGLGFSSTMKGEAIVRVGGTFSRTMKIIF